MSTFRLLIPCFAFLITGCYLKPSKIEMKDVESLTFYTTPRDFETPHAIQDFRELLEWNRDSTNGGMLCRDSMVCSPSAIKTFVQLVNELNPSANGSCDLRTVVAINFRSNDTRYIGFGKRWGTCYEGKSMRDDERLFQFLEDSIYSKHPQSYWWGAWTKAIMSGCYDYVDDDYTGIRAYSELKVDKVPLFNGDINGFHREFDRIANIPHMDGDTTKREIEVQFIITKSGEMTGPRIRGKEMNQLNEEEKQVIAIIGQIQNWNPGTYKGDPVDVLLNRSLSY